MIGFDELKLLQNLKNKSRYNSLEIRQEELKISNLNSKITAIENEIVSKITAEVITELGDNKHNCHLIAQLDLLCCFAEVSQANQYSLPRFNNDNRLQIIDGRNPIIEQFTDNFTSNSSQLNQKERIWLISGANMAGKSTFLRQNALITIMGHMGCFVPAKSADIALLKQIFTRIGNRDNLSQNQSTFMLEMEEIADILNNVQHNSLIIIDELGSSTSHQYGIALAFGIIKYLHDNSKSLALISTHYKQLCLLASELPALANYQISTEKTASQIKFSHKIKKGIADDSLAIDVANMTMLPKEVIQTASGFFA